MAHKVSSTSHKLPILLFLFSFSSIVFTWGSATVILIGKNLTLSFEDIAANFAPAIKSSGLCGKLHLAEPLDACSPLTNKIHPSGNSSSLFALITRNNCSFEEKVRRAQRAGFKAVIVYDNEDTGALVKMAGDSAGIKIHAVFVSKASGEKLSKFAGQDNIEVWLVPSFEDAAWSIMAISFIALLAMSALLATCFFVRRHRIRREQPRQQAREFHGMSNRLVKAMPSLLFTAVVDDNCTSSTCAICLDDYNVGDKIRVLPCKHKFHSQCVDCWLTSWRTFCPVCKRDARTSTNIPPASESTPLLSSAPSSVASSPVSSVQSSSLCSSSSAIRIASPSPRSCTSLVTNTPNRLNRPIYHHHNHHIPSSSMSMSRSSADLTHLSARRSASHLVSPSPNSSSLGYPSSPLNSRYMSPYMPSPAYMPPYIPSPSPSPSHMASSYMAASTSTSRPPNPLHYSESAVSFSSYASAQSLPGC